jgi:hypothetical protein
MQPEASALISLDRRIPFVDAVLSGDIHSAAAILKDAEERHQLRFTNLTVQLPEDQRQEWYASHLWPFLTETHFVLTGGDLLNGWSLVDTVGIDHTPTWRHWGELVADWANQHWMARPGGLGRSKWSQAKRPWEYLDFYMDVYLSNVIEGYAEWRDAVLRVLDAKNDVPAI